MILVSDKDCPHYPTEDECGSNLEGDIRIVQLRYYPGDKRLASMLDKWKHKDDPKIHLAIPDDTPAHGMYIPIRMCKAPIAQGTIIVY